MSSKRIRTESESGMNSICCELDECRASESEQKASQERTQSVANSCLLAVVLLCLHSCRYCSPTAACCCRSCGLLVVAGLLLVLLLVPLLACVVGAPRLRPALPM